MQLIVALSRRAPGLREVTLVYTEAKEYPPTQTEVDDAFVATSEEIERATLFICSGVYDIAVVPELSSAARSTNHQSRRSSRRCSVNEASA